MYRMQYKQLLSFGARKCTMLYKENILVILIKMLYDRIVL